MEKRAFLAVALSLLILVLYQEWMSRYYGAPPAPPAPAPQEAEKPRAAAPVAPPAKTEAMPGPGALSSAQPTKEIQAKEIKVETDNYVALFTTHGARLKSFKFKHYRSSVAENSPPFEIVPSGPGVPLPLGVRWQSPAPFDDGGIVYAAQGGDLTLDRDAKATLVFHGQTPTGMVITKSLTFSGTSYPITLEVAVKSSDGNAPVPEIVLTERSDHNVPNHDAPFEGFIALLDGKIKREHLPEPNQSHEFSGNVSWAGFGYTYFLSALLPEDPGAHKAVVTNSGSSVIAALGGPAGSARYTVFIGPKELDILKSVGKQLERSIDFGYFAFISIPFLYVLHFFHRVTGSYGIDIILLTVVLKLLMAPLTHKSFVSMKQMQKLQPQMERLKEKLGNDKEKLNKEIMELYRRNGVNPLGGCLPMVLQFPVFIGLYNALSTPIELRHAPFLWIKDLSRPDWQSLPFTVGDWHLGVPILTILMGASMFLQQWMTPSAGDPNQRKMMLMMPLMFTFMFVSFPAGLTVYWLVNNILTIGQQYWINRRES
jgi:YidC/Oxa1 family membrane protein insertase